MFQVLQFVFLTPSLSGNTLVLGNILLQFFISLLILSDIPRNLFKCLHSIAHGPQAVVLAHGNLAVVVLILVVALQIELITRIDFLPHLLIPHIDRIHHQRETIDITHLPVFIADGTSCILQGCTHALDIIGSIRRKLLHFGHRQSGQDCSVFTIFGCFLELVIVLGHVLNDGVVLLHFLLGRLKPPLRFASCLHIGLTL